MKNTFQRIAFCLLSVVGLFAPVAAQKTRRTSDLQAMVKTERAFSRMSEEKGIRESFAAFIADDGILFRPRAVRGKKWMQEHPLPASTTRPLLSWQPIYAAMSRAGDLGYDTGPWQYKNDTRDSKPSAFGNFMTVWKKQPDGTWKFVLDLGISHPAPNTTPKPTFVYPTAGLKAVDLDEERNGLLNEEREFSKASADLGAAEAFLLKADPAVRVFRENKLPFVGRSSAAKAMYPPSTVWTWTPDFADVSRSADLGYSYGTYELREKKTGNVYESGNYARVWKKVAGMWRVVIDVANPVAPDIKSN